MSAAESQNRYAAMEETEANEPMKAHRTRVLAEVVLVFLGILAAFSLESWWADRQDRERELALLSAMVAEFEAAGDEAASLLSEHERSAKEFIELHRLFKTSEASLYADSALDLTGRLWIVATFQPEMPSYQRLITAEGLAMIRNDSLRSALRSFELAAAANREFDDFMRDYDVFVLTPILGARLAWFPSIFGDGDYGGALRPDVNALASDLEFRNLIALRANNEAVLAERRSRLVDATREVLRLLELVLS